MSKEDRYFVARAWHEGKDTNRWCVWNPDRTFLAACDEKKDAERIAEAMNRQKEVPHD